MQMQRSPALIEKLKPILPVSRFNGKVVRTIVPKKKPINENKSESETMKQMEDTVEPMVAFTRPPPFSPIFGPLLMYSLLQSWSSYDEDDG